VSVFLQGPGAESSTKPKELVPFEEAIAITQPDGTISYCPPAKLECSLAESRLALSSAQIKPLSREPEEPAIASMV
jgi:hypothetical protein